MTIKIERIYKASQSDGFRILVDRLWPRGLSKEEARVGLWLKEIGPSNDLRGWFGHDPERWAQLKKRFFRSLTEKRAGGSDHIQSKKG